MTNNFRLWKHWSHMWQNWFHSWKIVFHLWPKKNVCDKIYCFSNKINFILHKKVVKRYKSRTKKTKELKNHCQINPHFPCKFGHFWTIFVVADWLHIWRPITQKLKIGNMIFHSFQHIAHLLCKDSHFGSGVCKGGGVGWQTTTPLNKKWNHRNIR